MPLIRLFADRVYTGNPEGDLPIGPARIDFADGRISAVVSQTRAAFEASPERLSTLDVGDKLVTPAFVNAHTHLSMAVFRGLGGDEARLGNVVEDLWFRIEGAQTPDDVRAFSRMGALECLLNGQGAVYDHYYFAASVAEALIDTGLQGVVAETLQDLGGPFAHASDRSLRAAVDLLQDERLAPCGVGVCLGPHATDTVSDALWERIIEVAHAHRVGLHLHVAQSAEEVARAHSFGHRSPVERLVAGGRLQGVERVWLAHGMHVDSADRGLLDPARDTVVHCPMAQTQFGFPADVLAWREAGLPVVVGTDAGACNDGMDVQRELVLLTHGPAYASTFGRFDSAAARDAHRIQGMASRSKWVDPAVALRSVWDVAGGLSPTHQFGQLTVGAAGSLCVWDLDHPAFWPAEHPLRALAFGAPMGALHTLIVGGAVIGEVGDVRALLRDARVAEWRLEATQRRAALLGQVG